jgi:hypothetical protein
MEETTTTVDTYVAAWNEGDTATCAALLEQVVSEAGTYTDPTIHVSGRDAIIDHVAGFEQRLPGATMERTSRVDGYGDVLRFAWAVVGSDGPVIVEGVDFVVLDEDRRIRSVTGFFGTLD